MMPRQKPTSEPFHHFNQHVCYAESEDGFTWTKPTLRLFEFEGSRDNNVVLTPYHPYPRNVHCPGVFVDDHGDPAERYKMVHFGSFSQERWANYRRQHPERDFGPSKVAWGLAVRSPDGIHWTLREDPLLIHFSHG